MGYKAFSVLIPHHILLMYIIFLQMAFIKNELAFPVYCCVHYGGGIFRFEKTPLRIRTYKKEYMESESSICTVSLCMY